MSMIKPRPNRVRMVRHISRLPEPIRDVLVAYAQFIGDTPDWVLNQLIDSTLAKERDFLAWRASQVATGTAAAASARTTAREAGSRADETL